MLIRACLPIHYSQVVVLRNTTGKAVRCRMVTDRTTTFWREVPAHSAGHVSVLRSKVEFGYVEIEGSKKTLPVKSTGEWNTPLRLSCDGINGDYRPKLIVAMLAGGRVRRTDPPATSG